VKKPFREHHLLTLLEEYNKQTLPLDRFLSDYFRSHKALGSKDRSFIAETVYSLMRWQGLLDHWCKAPHSWERRYQAYQSFDINKAIHDKEIPNHLRVSFPKVLFDLLVTHYGEQRALELCLASNEPAPTTVRINTLKTSREALFEHWRNQYSVHLCQHSPVGITFDKKINFFELPEFRAGSFEIQDEGSQLVAALVKAAPGQQIMDYCAGSGGKTLAFAPAMKGSGQIYLHDIRPHSLSEGRRRLRRAGIENAQIVQSQSPLLKKLKKKMDWVLVDVPCSGTGTLRRNPDMKWKFTQEMLLRLVGQQRTIFEQALSFLKPEGTIVYATCSILPEENQQQLEHFMKIYSLTLKAHPFQSLPKFGGMDGFFAATFVKNN